MVIGNLKIVFGTLVKNINLNNKYAYNYLGNRLCNLLGFKDMVYRFNNRLNPCRTNIRDCKVYSSNSPFLRNISDNVLVLELILSISKGIEGTSGNLKEPPLNIS